MVLFPLFFAVSDKLLLYIYYLRCEFEMVVYLRCIIIGILLSKGLTV